MTSEQERVGGSGRTASDVDKLRIFLNYRREDTRPYARLLYDALRERWPDDDQVFLDLDRISAVSISPRRSTSPWGAAMF